MKRGALARQQAGVYRLLGQGVAKGEAIRRFFDHQLRRYQLLDQCQQHQVAVAHDPLEQRKVESTPGDRSQGEQAVRLKAKP